MSIFNIICSLFLNLKSILFHIIVEANTASQEADESATDWKGGGSHSGAQTGRTADSSMNDAGKVKFDPPKVPVIFVLGKIRLTLTW